MPTNSRAELQDIRTFPSLVAYLKNRMGWPIGQESFENVEDLFFDYTAEELGLDSNTAAKIQEIKRLRPLAPGQPWGVFFVKFEPKRLPVVALRRILGQVVFKKRATAARAERASWHSDDLLFISNYGDGDQRQITFAHFSQDADKDDLPTLKVLGWDNLDTPLHLDAVAEALTHQLRWPDDPSKVEDWREKWGSAFAVGHREAITTSKELSIRLAQLARDIRDRIATTLAIETDRGRLTRLMKAFQQSLIHDLKPADFADMYAQTIAYGLLSARIANRGKGTADDLHHAMPVTNPFLKELMQTFLKVGGRRGRAGGPGIDFDELGISDVVDLLDAANMKAVVEDFGDRNPQEDPVIHFYESFLKEYDAQKRMQRGVFYTPRPVVSFIVRSVHELLQTEFGLEDGLADTTSWGDMARRHKNLKIPAGISPDQAFVQILDPATGTGTFLVEATDIIYKTMAAKWEKEAGNPMFARVPEQWNEYVPKHLLPRLHGYELLMAPYAIAHLKIGLKLHETGYKFGCDERARIYLTNALEPAQDFSGLLEFAIPALAHEAQAVNEIKRSQRFTVLLGNPPYSGHSLNNQVGWVVDKVYDYKRDYPDLLKPGQAKWLQDDYVKFLRFAEWQIECSNVGVVGFITNHAFLENPTFKGMRRHFIASFNRIAVLDLHGNANKQETATDGSPDSNVFEIKQGVAVSLLRRTISVQGESPATLERSDLRGTENEKFATLLTTSLQRMPSVPFRPIPPELVFVSLDDERKKEYAEFALLPAIMDLNGDPAPGIVTTHDEFAISFSREEQIEKVEALLATRSEAEARELFTLCSQDQWVYADAKRALRTEDWRKVVVPILYRPFDQRWTVYSRYVAVHRRERVSRHMLGGGNVGLSIPRSTEIKRGWEHVFCSRQLIQHHTVSLKEVNYLFPLWLESEWPATCRKANLSRTALSQVAAVTGLKAVDESMKSFPKQSGEGQCGRGDLRATFGPRDVFDYIYSVLHSGTYRKRYADFLKSDFARIPLTPTRTLFSELVRCGGELVDLHLMESTKLDHHITTYSGPKHPVVERVGWSGGTVWLDAAAVKKGQPALPGSIGFYGVPEEVWNFHIGGYQVCEKWLKDRRNGRALSDQDIRHYQRIVVALKETIRLVNDIDAVIDKYGGWPDAFAADGANRPLLAAKPETVLPTLVIPTEKTYPTAVTKPRPIQDNTLSSLMAADREPIAYGTSAPPPSEAAASPRQADREELICLLRTLFKNGASRQREDAIAEVAGHLGYQRIGSRLREDVEGALRTAVRRGVLENAIDGLVLAAKNITDYHRDFLKEQFLASLEGRAWRDRDEAIRAFARWMGFQRTTPVIDETARSLINGLIRSGRLESDGSSIRKSG